MCGFVVYAGSGAPDQPRPPNLAGPLAAIAHRGPDESTTRVVGPCVFGFQLLAIIDPGGSGQPMSYPPSGPDAGRWTVVCNGEIYNYRELRAQLSTEYGSRFATAGDVEVLAAALHVWGVEGLDRLRGMYAFAAWDSRERVLHAGRDPFGIKPLYYAPTGDGLWLASEKKSLLSTVDAGVVDEAALSYYLTLQYVPEPRTMQEGVRRLAPGERLEWRPGDPPGAAPGVVSWARPMFRAGAAGAGRASAGQASGLAGEIREALRDSVRAHMVADVPVGAFLSSGIDSTAVVALAREVKPDLRVYTAGFDTPGYSEIEAAERTADELGVHHTGTVVTADDVLAMLPRIVWHMDDPVADPSLIPLYFLARRAARDVTVVLSGEGADELFAGYEIYREPAALAGVQRLPRPVHRGLRAVARAIPEGVRGRSFLYRATTPIEARYYGNARIFDQRQKESLMRGPVAPHTDVTAEAYAAATALDDVTTMQYVDLRTWLPGDILTKADRMSMAHSLELRVPFLDRRVFAAAARVPTGLKVPRTGRVTKAALRLALRDVVPASVVNRRKLGFPTPTRVWLRGPIGEWTGEVLHRSAAGDLLDLGYAQRLLADHRRGAADHSRKVWTVLTFCLWYAIFVEESLPVPPVGGASRDGKRGTAGLPSPRGRRRLPGPAGADETAPAGPRCAA